MTAKAKVKVKVKKAGGGGGGGVTIVIVLHMRADREIENVSSLYTIVDQSQKLHACVQEIFS